MAADENTPKVPEMVERVAEEDVTVLWIGGEMSQVTVENHGSGYSIPPTVPEMVARVARAIAQADIPGIKLAPGAFYADVYKDMALAAIAAMREPTEAMVDALLKEKLRDEHSQHERDVATLDWQKLIAAALGK